MSSVQPSWFHPAAQTVADFARPRIDSVPPVRDADWNAVEACAIRMGLFPLFAQRILDVSRAMESSRDAGIPPEVLRQWKARLQRHCGFTLVLVHENERLMSCFAAAGIHVVAVKGPTLAERIYGNPLLRDYEDLDYVVPFSMLEAACDVLEQVGFTPERYGPRSAEFRAALSGMDHHTREIRYCREVAGITVVVELHWDVFPEGDHLEQPDVGRPEVYALYLALHGSRHLWQPLKHLCDYRDWIASHSDVFDWDAYLDLARRQKLRAVATAAPLLVAALALGDNSAIPREESTEGGSLSPQLLRYVQSQPESMDNLWAFHLRRALLQDSLGQRCGYLLRLVTPTEGTSWSRRCRHLVRRAMEQMDRL